MKLEQPRNENYAAVVVTLPPLRPLEGCDNLVGAALFGFQAILDKSHAEGELGVMFPPETQLSESFCAENGLYRHSDKNRDKDAKGYLEDNRRVRAIKLRGHRSDCLFMPLSSLAYIKGVKLDELKPGDTFDHLEGQEVCRKYVIRRPNPGGTAKTHPARVSRVSERQFPLHLDTANYWRNAHLIGPDEHIYVTQKLHGTSFRAGRPLVTRKLTLRDRIAKRLGVKVVTQEHDGVFGSRRVVKDANNPDQDHFYDTDLWTMIGKVIEPTIPDGYLVFGELIGWTPDGVSPIQSNYTYDAEPGTFAAYVYRVAHVNAQGIVCDLSWPQVRRFCEDRGLAHVPDLWEGRHADFDAGSWIDRRFHPYHENAVPVSDPKSVDEGVCVRADNGLVPTILKAKSPVFLAHETKLLDKGVADMESADDEVADDDTEDVA